jgi:N-carbamoyl-L-amino-acid hydrolase
VRDINASRLLADIDALARIGGLENGGVDRLAWSEADLAGRRWYAQRLGEAGLQATIDPALNVFGHLPGARGPFVLTGSHLDTVPNGGRLDGAYGAVAALEVLRTLVESGDGLANRVEVVGFSDEEGVRFSIGLLGSLALAGELPPLDQLEDREGVPVRETLSRVGSDLDRLPEAQAHLQSLAGFVELHIEQGPRMEAQKLDLAVVTGIVAVHRRRVRVIGTQNHAGTTPFSHRHDAGRAAARIAGSVQELVQAIDSEAVANVGTMSFEPGAINVIPGEASLSLEVRHLDEGIIGQILEAFDHRLEQICMEEGCAAEQTVLSSVPAALMEAGQMALIAASVEEVGARPGRLWSGAGHDAAVLSRHVPTGMLFVPSIGGISHAPAEATADEHLVLGARALLRAVSAAAARIK